MASVLPVAALDVLLADAHLFAPLLRRHPSRRRREVVADLAE
jgi:hypothetical protein